MRAGQKRWAAFSEEGFPGKNPWQDRAGRSLFQRASRDIARFNSSVTMVCSSIARGLLHFAGAGMILCTINACALKPPLPPPEPVKPAAPVLYEWKGDETPGPVTVEIDLSEQKASIYRGGVNVGWTFVATGKKGHATPAGKFKILEKIRHKSSNRYGVIVNKNGRVVDSDAKAGRDPVPEGGRFVGARMPYWMRLTGYGIGMHMGPIPRPGQPASHGCIRLPEIMAEKLFSLAPVGTTVTIKQ
jgi:hypothetical protein